MDVESLAQGGDTTLFLLDIALASERGFLRYAANSSSGVQPNLVTKGRITVKNFRSFGDYASLVGPLTHGLDSPDSTEDLAVRSPEVRFTASGIVDV